MTHRTLLNHTHLVGVVGRTLAHFGLPTVVRLYKVLIQVAPATNVRVPSRVHLSMIVERFLQIACRAVVRDMVRDIIFCFFLLYSW